jgi:hypothetical protein
LSIFYAGESGRFIEGYLEEYFLQFGKLRNSRKMVVDSARCPDKRNRKEKAAKEE